MIGGKRVVVVSPAGRRRYLELLIPQVQGLKQYVDELRLWVNTNNGDDITYMQKTAAGDPDFIKLEYLSVPYNGIDTIYTFFKNCIDENTVYVRFDDDIVLLDTPDAFRKFIDFRINNPQYFLVYGNILNNAIVSHIHQRHGKLNLDKGVSGYTCMDNLGWRDGNFALNVHQQVLSTPLSYYHFTDIWQLFNYDHVSINCISWTGSEFGKFAGIVGPAEEDWLSVVKPREIKKHNCIFGEFVCVHYAFGTQRDKLDSFNILDGYKQRLLKEPGVTIA